MRILVCGGRDYDDGAKVSEVLDGLLIQHEIELLIHGGASGADSLAAQWAERRGVQQVVFGSASVPAPTRTRIMLDTLLRSGEGLIVAFPGGLGTAELVDRARARGITVIDGEEAAELAPHPALAAQAFGGSTPAGGAWFGG